jgi:hypothetical protein
VTSLKRQKLYVWVLLRRQEKFIIAQKNRRTGAGVNDRVVRQMVGTLSGYVVLCCIIG